MAGVCAIDEPQVLLSLPRALASADSKASVAAAYGLVQARKRKRPELVIGVDGECLNVYNVKTPRLISSYAIPPQTHFTAAPYALLRRGQDRATRRYVYAATHSTLGSGKSQIVCYREEKLGRADGTAAPVQTATSLGSPEEPVVYLDSHLPRASEGDEEHELLAVHRNGTVNCVSEDLSEIRWTSKLAPANGANEDFHIDHVQSVKASEAAQGVFKDRPEVLALLQPTEDADSAALEHLQLLFAISHEKDGANVHAHAFCIRSLSSLATQRSFIQHLCSWPLPGGKSGTESAREHSFDARTGILQSRTGSSLANLDLSASKVQTLSVFAPIPSSSSFLPVSARLTLISSKTSCQLYETRFKSLQAVQTASAAHAAGAGGRKRKRTSLDGTTQAVRLVQYFTRLGLAVGILGNEVIGYLVKLPPQSSKQERGSRLIDALGRAAPSAQKQEKDESLLALIQLADKRDVTGFEKLFFKLVTMKKQKKLQPQATEASKSPAAASGELTEERTNRLGECALAAIFVREDGTDRSEGHFGFSDGIRIKFLPTNVFRWLSLYQFVRPEHISTALRYKTTPTMRLRSITYESIASAVANADPSLVLLSDLVTKSSMTGHGGLVRTLRILLRSFDTPQIQRADRMLANGAADSAADSAERGPEDELEAEESAAQWDLDIASIMLEDGPSGRGLALRNCCEKLAGGYAAREVVRSLRNQMSRRDLALLIELLRFELANGGWTSRSLDYAPDNLEAVGQDEIIWVICELLNRALDALGTGGWLGSGPGISLHKERGDDDDIDSNSSSRSDSLADQVEDEILLMQQLRDDASAVVEGVQESSFFAGFLRDFIRFSDSVAATTAPHGDHGRAGRRRKGALLAPVESSVLPLGGGSNSQRDGLTAAASSSSTTRVSLGGALGKRSRREIAARRGRQVAVYSLDRLRV